MKINQFAKTTPEIGIIKTELTQIGFPTTANSPIEMLKKLIQRAFWQVSGSNNQIQQLNQYLASPTQTLGNFLATNTAITAENFNLIALQLLGFQAEADFAISEASASAQKLNVSFHNHFETSDDVLINWYQLLNTHTKFGLTYLDQLAAQGYYAQNEISVNQPLFFNGKAQATFLTKDFLYETVYVQTDFDSDNDGFNDLIKVEVTRPTSDQPVPVAYTASPYDQGVNDSFGDRLTHAVDVPLTEKPAGTISLQSSASLRTGKAQAPKSTTESTTETHTPKPGYTLNDYLLVRGFASVYAAGIGTIDSDGFQTCGDDYQVASTIAVIEWLHGDRIAFTNRTDQIAIAASWCNQNISMTGRSYLGTLAIAAATTGVPGLKTIIPEAAISSWYDYYRENGLVVAPGGFQGEDADVLAAETFSKSLRPGDYLTSQKTFDQYLQQMQLDQDRETGSYNQFWEDRNYRKNLKNVTADVLLVHGLNDWNVKLRNPAEFWQGIQNLPISKKLILHQGQHVYINAFPSFDFSDIVNLWLSNKLYGVKNHVDQVLPDVIVQDNVDEDTWITPKNWLSDKVVTQSLNFDKSEFKNELPEASYQKYCQAAQLWKHHLYDLNNPELSEQRIASVSASLEHDLTINGEVELDLAIASDQNLGMLHAALVDLGDAKRLEVNPQILAPKGVHLGYRWYTDNLREFKLAKAETPFKMISQVHLNLQNRTSTQINESIVPNQFYQIHLKFQPTFYKLPAGRKLAVILYGTDFEMTNRGNQKIHYQINNHSAQLHIPTN